MNQHTTINGVPIVDDERRKAMRKLDQIGWIREYGLVIIAVCCLLVAAYLMVTEGK